MNQTDATPIARAFLYRNLSQDQKETVRKVESSLPAGRYLTPYEIAKLFHLSYGEITEVQEQAMREKWREYEKILWKNRAIEDKRHETFCASEGCSCKTKQIELAEWAEWASENYVEPLIEPKTVIKNLSKLAFLFMLGIR